jgi:hypothetical protein
VVGDDLDLVQQVRGQQHRAAACGEVLQQPAHPVDPGRVQAVGRLVEHQHLRLADQGVRDPEPLPHAQRVVAEAPVAFLAGQPDQLQHRVDPAPRQPHQDRVQPEDLPAGPAGVLAEASSSTPTCRPGLLSRA